MIIAVPSPLNDRLSNPVVYFYKHILTGLSGTSKFLKSLIELKRMTSLADFCCALPILSATLVNGVLGSPTFELQLSPYYTLFTEIAPELIHTAYKLRNLVLFRECLIHVLSD
jgi:hypothetical protein